MFDFDVPINDDAAADATHDAWFAVPHAALLKPACEDSASEAATAQPKGPLHGTASATSSSSSSSDAAANGDILAVLAHHNQQLRDGKSATRKAQQRGRRRSRSRSSNTGKTSSGSGSGSTSTTTSNAGKSSRVDAAAHGLDSDIEALLRAHNAKLKGQQATYEPRHKSVREVRQWESMTGKRYSSLSVPDRAAANRAIRTMVQQQHHQQRVNDNGGAGAEAATSVPSSRRRTSSSSRHVASKTTTTRATKPAAAKRGGRAGTGSDAGNGGKKRSGGGGGGGGGGGDDGDDDDLAALLAKHNAKLKPKPVFEPRHGSVREVRAWEKMSGRKYSELTVAERADANREIKAMKSKS